MNKKIILAAILVLVVTIGIWKLTNWDKTRTVPTVVEARVERPELGISFAFPSGEEALGIMQPEVALLVNGQVLSGVFILTDNKTETKARESRPEGIEIPRISIFVFEKATSSEDVSLNTASSTMSVSKYDLLKSWSESNNSLSGFDKINGEIYSVEIDNVPAINYVSEGVYLQDTYVVTYHGRTFMIVGQYIVDGDEMNTMFQQVVESIYFF